MKLSMKRDMDLIRKVLLEIEDGKKFYEIRSSEVSAALGISDEGGLSREEAHRWEYNMGLLKDEGYVDFSLRSGGVWWVEGITWKGHDFLDSVRDPEIWAKTKAGAAKVGGFTVDTLLEIAKGYIRTKLKEHAGVEADL